MARLLLAEDTAQRQEAARQQEIVQLEATQKPAQPTTQSPPPADSSKWLKALHQASKRSQCYTQARRKQLDELAQSRGRTLSSEVIVGGERHLGGSA